MFRFRLMALWVIGQNRYAISPVASLLIVRDSRV
jgi:hypothetical protein